MNDEEGGSFDKNIEIASKLDYKLNLIQKMTCK